MTISFIIPLYNCLPLTQAMLASLQATLPPGIDSEIIFVDDGSTDGTRAWLKKLPASCRAVLNNSNVGFAGACNRGTVMATGEFLFFLNNDLVLLPHWLEPMLDGFNRFSDAGLIGNVQLNATTGEVDHAGIFFNYKGKPAHETARPLSARLTGYRRVAALTGACFAIRRTTWEQLGGFDESFVNGSEDIDLCLRAHSIGLRHYLSTRSVVRHHISASPGRKLRDEQNTYRLVQRWRDKIAQLSARDWSRNFIATHWDRSFVYDDILGREALYCWLGLLPVPSPRLLAGVQGSVEIELERWAQIFAAKSN